MKCDPGYRQRDEMENHKREKHEKYGVYTKDPGYRQGDEMEKRCCSLYL
jgi:hypothetical protein